MLGTSEHGSFLLLKTFINFARDVLATGIKGGQEFVVWNPKTRRCEWKALEEM